MNNRRQTPRKFQGKISKEIARERAMEKIIQGTNLNLLAPNNLVGVLASSSRVDLTFDVNDTKQDGHRIYISTDDVSYTEKGTVSGLTETYSATGLTANTTYYFKVVAYKNTLESDFSNVVQKITTWEAIMYDSYRTLNPEQADWFDTVEVATIAERDALIPTKQIWCYVADVAGTSKEYVFDINRSLWIDAKIDGKATLLGGSSGKASKNELIARLAPTTYYYTTFGPAGKNKSTCDFLYLMYTKGDLISRRISSTDYFRWDIDSNVFLSQGGASGFPVYTLGAGKGIITVSNNNSNNTWAIVTAWQTYGNTTLSGACPKFVFNNIVSYVGTGGEFNISVCNFSGTCPNFSLLKTTRFKIETNNFVGNLPPFNFPELINSFSIDANSFSGDFPCINFYKATSSTAISFLSTYFSSFDAFLINMYNNRLSYIGASSPIISITDANFAEPTPVGTSPSLAYSAGVVNAKYAIHILTVNPLTETFNKIDIRWNIEIHEKTVIFTSDSYGIDLITKAQPVFDNNNVLFTDFIATSFINATDYLTTAQIVSLYNDGFGTECHSNTHATLTSLNEAQILAEYDAVNLWFTNAGLPIPKYTAYPGGWHNNVVMEATRKRRKIGRGVAGSVYRKITNTMDVLAYSLDGITSGNVNAQKTIIDNVKTTDGLIIFYFHEVYISSSSECLTPAYSCQVSAINELILYCKSNGINVKSMGEFFDTKI